MLATVYRRGIAEIKNTAVVSSKPDHKMFEKKINPGVCCADKIFYLLLELPKCHKKHQEKIAAGSSILTQ